MLVVKGWKLFVSSGLALLQVGVLLLGAPWLSKAFVKLRGDGSCDVCATCDAYIAQLQSIMLPLTRQAAQVSPQISTLPHSCFHA